MTSHRSMWSGVALIVAGLIFLAASNTGGRSSTLGLIVGLAIIVMGIYRLVRGRGASGTAE